MKLTTVNLYLSTLKGFDEQGQIQLKLDPIADKFTLSTEVQPKALNGLTIKSAAYYEVTGSYKFTPSLIFEPQPVLVEAPKPALERIKDFVLQIAQSGADATEAANRFLNENPELVTVAAIATAGIIFALLFSGPGGWTVSLTLIPRLASVVSALIRVAQLRT